MWETAWAPSISTMVSGLFSLASAVISFTGLIVPSVLETWPTATMRVRGESRFR